jgi:hypothetical protein
VACGRCSAPYSPPLLAYDRAALLHRGADAATNFSPSEYEYETVAVLAAEAGPIPHPEEAWMDLGGAPVDELIWS